MGKRFVCVLVVSVVFQNCRRIFSTNSWLIYCIRCRPPALCLSVDIGTSPLSSRTPWHPDGLGTRMATRWWVSSRFPNDDSEGDYGVSTWPYRSTHAQATTLVRVSVNLNNG